MQLLYKSPLGCVTQISTEVAASVHICWKILEVSQRGQGNCPEAQLAFNVAQHAVMHLGIPQELPLYTGKRALEPLQAL